MITGSEAYKRSVDSPEPPYDPAYGRDQRIITENPDDPNELMKANSSLLDHVTAFEIASQKNQRDTADDLLRDIDKLVRTPGMNNSEFASFWATNDMSFSIYNSLADHDRLEFLAQIVPEYVARRHTTYKRHGYTGVTLQAKSDSFAHKRSGPLAAAKIRELCKELGYQHRTELEPPESHTGRWFAMPDECGGSAAFDQWIEDHSIAFPWGRAHSGKLPDVVLCTGLATIIVEHKHMKESGGGQDKQLVELIEFIRQPPQNSPDVRYVSFLDGILFNALASRHATGKLRSHQRAINEALEEHPANCFVNTAGFRALLESV